VPTISLATSAERGTVLQLLSAQMAEHAIDTPNAALDAAIRGMLEEPRYGFILLAREGATEVGVAWVSTTWSLEHGGLTSWLEELYVIPPQRSSGIGRALLHEVIARTRALGCAAIDLEVDVEHARAEHLYEREGFSRLPRARWVRRRS
jgi:GNAT superfamily N-acetyltransferase